MIESITSGVYLPFSLSSLSSSGLIRSNSPAAEPWLNTLATNGSIPWLTPPIRIAELILGAIASKWVLRTPNPLHNIGSPSSSASVQDASLACFLIEEKILVLSMCASISSKAIPRFWSSVWNPKVPKPIARLSLVNLTAFSNPRIS